MEKRQDRKRLETEETDVIQALSDTKQYCIAYDTAFIHRLLYTVLVRLRTLYNTSNNVTTTRKAAPITAKRKEKSSRAILATTTTITAATARRSTMTIATPRTTRRRRPD